MASGSCYLSNLNYIVHRPPTEPAEVELCSPTPDHVQVELTMTLQLEHVQVQHHGSCDLYFELNNANPLILQATRRFRPRILKYHYVASQVLGLMLSQLELPLDSPMFDNCIEVIIRHGLRLEKLKSNRGRKILPLCVDFVGTLEEHVNFEAEGAFLMGAVAESELEFERSNYGIVPAQESAVKKMLKRVRVEDEDEEKGGERTKRKCVIKGENCVICLEELKVGSYASRMPCSHAFHCDCIEKWLKVSHDCPICRFEIPTSDS